MPEKFFLDEEYEEPPLPEDEDNFPEDEQPYDPDDWGETGSPAD